MESKKLTQSRTFWFFIAILSGGGLDLINQLIQSSAVDVRSILLTLTGLIGIGLRIITEKPVRM